MALRINESWKVLIGTLGLSLVSCGAPLEDAVTVMLNGDMEMTLRCGVDAWIDPGATAVDGAGDPLEVVTYNSGRDEHGPGPNADVAGTYFVQYAAHDDAWNSADVIRTVHVVDCPATPATPPTKK